MIEITTVRSGLFVVAYHQPNSQTIVIAAAFTRSRAEQKLLKTLDKQYGKKSSW